MANEIAERWRLYLGLALATSLLLPIPGFGAQGETENEPETLRGADLPMNTVVETLYRYFWDYRDWGPDEWHYFLHHDLEIIPGSECAILVETAMEEARRVDGQAPELPVSLKRSEYERRQLAAIEAKARSLGRVYWLMRSELIRKQCPVAPMDEFMNTRVRRSISLSRAPGSDEPFTAERVEDAFQEAKREVEAARTKEKP